MVNTTAGRGGGTPRRVRRHINDGEKVEDMRATAPTRLNLAHVRRRYGRALFEERAAGTSREAFRVKIAEIASRRGGG